MARARKHAEAFKDRAGRYRYRVVAANGEIVDQSQSYSTRQNARRAARTNTGLPVVSVDLK